MNQQVEPTAEQGAEQRSAGRDGLAAVAIILITVGLIAFVVSSLV
ncbi:MAG: hypothetical protein ACRBK7_05470 [Acidimicrobiales bacterium]